MLTIAIRVCKVDPAMSPWQFLTRERLVYLCRRRYNLRNPFILENSGNGSLETCIQYEVFYGIVKSQTFSGGEVFWGTICVLSPLNRHRLWQRVCSRRELSTSNADDTGYSNRNKKHHIAILQRTPTSEGEIFIQTP